MGAVTVGCDLGQRSDYTAVCVAEADERREGERDATHYSIRHLERLPLMTPYPAVARRLAAIVDGIVRRQLQTVALRSLAPGVYVTEAARKPEKPVLFVDATGLGRPVIDVLKEANIAATLVPVTFTHGDKQTWAHGEIVLGKAFLVAHLQALLQTNRLHLPDTDEARALAEELKTYEINVSENGNATFGAFRTGTHDDLTTALGLACRSDPRPRLRAL